MTAGAGWRAALACAAGLAAVLAATSLAYAPGLNGPLVFDDLPNLIEQPRVRLRTLTPEAIEQAVYASYDHLPRRGLAYLSFGFNHLASGGTFNALHLKVTNLAIHLCAGVVLFWLSRRLARRAAPAGAPARGADLLALMVTAVWLLHPIQLTSVLYVVQRMTSLSALFVLAGVACYVAGRGRLEQGRRGGAALMVGGILGGAGLGVLAKENALLLPAFTVLVELFFFRRDTLAPGARRGVWALHAVCFGLPALAVLAVLVLRIDLLQASYASRDFTLWERLLTQGRVMGDYVQMIVFPRLSGFGLFHDDVAVSRGLFSPPSTAIAAAAWIGVAAATAWGLVRRAGWAFGVAWFLAGHVMESSVIGLEMMHEHRNYLPLAGLVLGVALSARKALARMPVRRPALLAACALPLMLLAFLTHTRADIWSSLRTLMEFATVTHPNSYRAAGYAASIRLIEGVPLATAYRSWAQAARLGTADHAALLELIKLVAYLRDGEHPPHGAACAPAGEIPLQVPDSRECLDRLLESMLAEMHRRAREGPIPAGTVTGFKVFADCAAGDTGYCTALRDDLEVWLRAALAGGRSRPRMRPQLMLALAELHLGRGDVPGALALTEEATRESGYHPALTRYLVGVYLLLGEPAKARASAAKLLDPEYRRPGNVVVARELARTIADRERDGARGG